MSHDDWEEAFVRPQLKYYGKSITETLRESKEWDKHIQYEIFKNWAYTVPQGGTYKISNGWKDIIVKTQDGDKDITDVLEHLRGGQCCGAPNLRRSISTDSTLCESCGDVQAFENIINCGNPFTTLPSPIRVCECGGDKVNAGHSRWCPKWEVFK